MPNQYIQGRKCLTQSDKSAQNIDGSDNTSTTTEEISNLIKEVNPTGENEPSDILSKLEVEMEIEVVNSAEAEN